MLVETCDANTAILCGANGNCESLIGGGINCICENGYTGTLCESNLILFISVSINSVVLIMQMYLKILFLFHTNIDVIGFLIQNINDSTSQQEKHYRIRITQLFIYSIYINIHLAFLVFPHIVFLPLNDIYFRNSFGRPY